MHAISYIDAQQIARRSLLEHFPDLPGELLSDVVMERPFGWMFFPHESIAYPKDSFFSNEAIVVTKRGNVRFVRNYLNDPDRLEVFLSELGEFLEARRE